MHKTQSKLWSQKQANKIQGNQSKEHQLEYLKGVIWMKLRPLNDGDEVKRGR